MEKNYPYPQRNSSVKWVDTEWLKGHLNDDMAILDVQPNIHDYIVEHLPGAAHLDQEFLRSSLGGLPGQFMPPEAVAPYFNRVGVTMDRPVLVYSCKGPSKGWGDGLEQTMMAYGLTRSGHDKVLILDGGLEKWKANEGQTTQQFPRIKEGDFRGREMKEFYVGYDEFKRTKDDDNVLLLDARPAAVYEGKGAWPKAGHIPGAISLPWASLMSKDNPRELKPDGEIQEIIGKVEATPDRSIICSCGTGREATNEFNLFKWYLGYPDVRIYEGSFTEWSSYPDNPTVTGPDPRGPEQQVVQQR